MRGACHALSCIEELASVIVPNTVALLNITEQLPLFGLFGVNSIVNGGIEERFSVMLL